MSDGRYVGDYQATLEYNTANGKYPYRVCVEEWRPEWGGWFEGYVFLDHFESRQFRTLEGAVKYKHKVLRAADVKMYRRVELRAAEDKWVSLELQ